MMVGERRGVGDLFKTAVDTMESGVVICDSTGELQYANAACATLLGTTPSALTGVRIDDLVATDAGEQLPGDEVSEGERRSVETAYRFDGVTVPVTEVTTRQRVEGEVYLFKTVTLRTAAEQQLERENAELQSQCDRLEVQKAQFESFARVASHDLRNPLSIAQGYLQTVRTEPADDDSLEKVSNAHSRMEALIEDLLSLAREGEVVGTIRRVSLGRIAESAWANTWTVDATLTVDECTVYADPVRTQQLFENLFRNAVEHAGAAVGVRVGGMAGIATSTRVDAEAELAVGFYVADDGPGVPSADREAVFSDSYTTNENGTGLGLRTVKEIATAHGWRVRCTESSEGGARFEFHGTARKPDA